ncbi:MAG: hypothetical protein HYR85_11390 [Planctomycetes bacterium]|nr:hypothetical protein [Planctomycetota bacterium]MBI3846493.1 hypothetical protein [Planctomycetota bacterium]
MIALGVALGFVVFPGCATWNPSRVDVVVSGDRLRLLDAATVAVSEVVGTAERDDVAGDVIADVPDPWAESTAALFVHATVRPAGDQFRLEIDCQRRLFRDQQRERMVRSIASLDDASAEVEDVPELEVRITEVVRRILAEEMGH